MSTIIGLEDGIGTVQVVIPVIQILDRIEAELTAAPFGAVVEMWDQDGIRIHRAFRIRTGGASIWISVAFYRRAAHGCERGWSFLSHVDFGEIKNPMDIMSMATAAIAVCVCAGVTERKA